MGEETCFRITWPVRRPPIAFPRTAGTRWEPALVFEASSVTWKYRGMENII